MNALTPSNPAGTALTTGPAYDPFAQVAAELGATMGSFLKFSGNDGNFAYGPKDDEKELVHGTQLVSNFFGTFKRGYICWKDSEVVGEEMRLVSDGGTPVREEDLEDHGPYEVYKDGTKDGWSEQVAFEMVNLDDGMRFTLKLTSASALKAVGNLTAQFAKVYKTHLGSMPVIEISANGFDIYKRDADGKKTKTKQGQKFAPVFKIVGWVANEEYEELVSRGQASEGSDDGSADGEDDAANYVPAPTAAPAKTEAPSVPATTGGRRGKRF